MSGCSLEDAISFSDDEDGTVAYSEDEVDVQRYDSEDSVDEDEPIANESDEDDDLSFYETAPPSSDPLPESFELPKLSLECGDIRPDSVVELKDHSGRTSKHLLSGDFFLVRSIVENVHTEEVVIRGYRMRRVEYLQPLFDRKLNDLFILIEVQEGDQRPRFVQGLQEISCEEVTRIRRCVFTNLNYELLGQSQVNSRVPLRLKTKDEIREWVFQKGRLICRWVHVVEQHYNAKSYGGEARRVLKREVAEFSQHEIVVESSSTSTPIPMARASSSTTQPPLAQSHKRNGSVQEAPNPSKRLQHCPRKCPAYTFGDGYCGCGGCSAGAQQAGYQILWGLEKDAKAMQAYKKNFPGAVHLEMDAHDFPNMARRCIHGCDHLHMSCPCCFWSVAHTVDGKNDEANMMTLFTVEAWLHKVKPRTFSLEQAPGLLTQEKHRKFFRILVNGILNRGYNVRWKIQDQAWFGIAQHRRRLVFVGAKIGIPLPPFPSPIHGPTNSGLKRYVTIKDALQPLEQQAFSFQRDTYHQPHLEKPILDREAFDPHVNLAKCITTSGGENVHHSGKRANTCRELAQFQGFPANFRFTGSATEAKKQCGNAWPVKANKIYFLTWAAHMEAFDHGFIDAEDEVLDIYEFLENKGITIPKPAPIELDFFATPPRHSTREPEPEYRYLSRIEKTVQPRGPLQIWAKRKELDPLPQRRRRNNTRQPVVFSSGLSHDTEASSSRTEPSTVRRRKQHRQVLLDGEIITIPDSDSE
ncbi:S-adenosyl-L-methionine-dependent methyltransferase [Cucurbitaria berberidis CBS 394.84]|uniref:DNA (cytosine-5-)-methyltransferase n=1 Tax=Cucurbitaria berberidis CBS 394.84 TaxID=1168544 RepID=A0A9P4LES5_9PLEO|nr:S-adenosyl-L-methionine-dependent methyltransferase [Cucurbitaria berberidis CBS 394.84]KAF1851662.1 S-adenosyl-L-methionine-dependent methyltransferase [Cucurbitaria berberidis CBS 394.84]